MGDNELLSEFIEEAREHLGSIEMQLLQIEALGVDIDDDLVNTVFRAVHSVKGAAGFLGLTQINNVAHSLENVLGRVREHTLVPDAFNVDVMLKAADRLSSLIEDIETSNETNNAEICEKLDALLADVASDSASADGDAGVDSTTDEPAVSSDEAANPSRDAEHTSQEELQVAETGVAEAVSPEPPSAPLATPAPPAAATVAAKPAPKTSEPSKRSTGGESNGGSAAPEATIRVGVRVLDRLMNLAGELVLSRNQLLRTIGNHTAAEGNGSLGNLDSIASDLDQVTTELQETIMQTRMQPIGSVFNKFPRIVRDLSSSLGKSIDLQLEGVEVETDKTIVEAIADPLTHLVRNSCDHGVENPEKRRASGKPEMGTVILRAFHQAGKVMIEIRDDGAGMDAAFLKGKAIEKGVITEDAAARMSDRDAVNLIFAPGFSTAAAVTDVSGRGVGMDVVRTNIEKIGGSVEVESVLGQGSVIRITLPLTLAIVPSMIVSVDDRRYALPQTNIVELVQTDGQEKRIDHVSNAEVLHLRGSLIPLVRLNEILCLPGREERRGGDRSKSESQLVVVESGRVRFALAVDRVLDSEEIVVKPLGRHLSDLPLLAGSTILGDGRVAMILDATGIASGVKLASDADSGDTAANDQGEDSKADLQRLVLLSVSDKDHFGLPMDIVSRIERVEATVIDEVGEMKLLKYRGGTLPLVSIEEVIPVNGCDTPQHVHVIVFKVRGREVGLIAPHLNDIRDCPLDLACDSNRRPGVAGVAVIDGCATRLLDLYGLTEIARPDWFEARSQDNLDDDRVFEILVCEDSAFFRGFLTRTLTEEGYSVTACEDGEEGWVTLNELPDKFDMLITDVEMPELDGIGLTKRIRHADGFDNLPIIALTSLADEESTRRGIDAGVNDYQVKMNKPELLGSIHRNLRRNQTS